MPDVEKARVDLCTYITAGYSVLWSISKVVNDYRLHMHTGKGNAWIDDIVSLIPPGTKMLYI